MTDVLFAIGDVLMLVALAEMVIFATSYASFFNWRKTAAGRSLMYLSLALVTWALQTSISRMDPAYFGREWVRVVVYGVIVYAMGRLIVTLWKSWHKTPFNIEPRKKDDHAE